MFGREAKSKTASVAPSSKEVKVEEKVQPVSKSESKVSAGAVREPSTVPPYNASKPQEQTTLPSKPAEKGFARDVGASTVASVAKSEEPSPVPVKPQEKQATTGWAQGIAATVTSRDVKPEEPAPGQVKPQERAPTSKARDVAATIPTRDVEPEEPVPTPVRPQETRGTSGWARDVAATLPSRDVGREEPLPISVTVQETRAPTGLARDVASTVPARDVAATVPARDVAGTVPARDARPEELVPTPVKVQETRAPTGLARDAAASVPARDAAASVPARDRKEEPVPTPVTVQETRGYARDVGAVPAASFPATKSEERVPVVSKPEETGIGAYFTTKETAKPEVKTTSVARPEEKTQGSRVASAAVGVGVAVTDSRTQEKVPAVGKPVQKDAPVKTGAARK